MSGRLVKMARYRVMSPRLTQRVPGHILSATNCRARHVPAVRTGPGTGALYRTIARYASFASTIRKKGRTWCKKRRDRPQAG